MVIANVVGDLIAVFIFKSLAIVAVASILFTLIGVIVGYHFLDKELRLNHRSVFIEGFEFYKSSFYKIRSHLPKYQRNN